MLTSILLHNQSNKFAGAAPLHIGNFLNIIVQARQHRQADPLLQLPILLRPTPASGLVAGDAGASIMPPMMLFLLFSRSYSLLMTQLLPFHLSRNNHLCDRFILCGDLTVRSLLHYSQTIIDAFLCHSQPLNNAQ